MKNNVITTVLLSAGIVIGCCLLINALGGINAGHAPINGSVFVYDNSSKLPVYSSKVQQQANTDIGVPQVKSSTTGLFSHKSTSTFNTEQPLEVSGDVINFGSRTNTTTMGNSIGNADYFYSNRSMASGNTGMGMLAIHSMNRGTQTGAASYTQLPAKGGYISLLTEDGFEDTGATDGTGNEVDATVPINSNILILLLFAIAYAGFGFYKRVNVEALK